MIYIFGNHTATSWLLLIFKCLYITGDGQGSLACCSPWGRKESDTTEWLNWLTDRYIIGENSIFKSTLNLPIYSFWKICIDMFPLWMNKVFVLLQYHAAAAAAKSLQSCPTLCDPMDCSPPGSPVPGILQARILEWVAISFSNAWKWKVKVKLLIHVRLLVTPWTAAHQAPPSMGFSRQEYWSGVS